MQIPGLKSFDELLAERRADIARSVHDARVSMRSYALLWRRFRAVDPAWNFPIRMAIQLRGYSLERIQRGQESLARLEADFLRLGWKGGAR